VAVCGEDIGASIGGPAQRQPVGVREASKALTRGAVVHVEHRDMPAATVLTKRGVVDGAIMIHHIDGAAVLAHDEIGRIAEQTPNAG
jgi:hypothetical protein